MSTDDFAGWLALQTNLALKGIIGIKAMSELGGVVGNHTEQEYYKVWAVDCLSENSSNRNLPEHIGNVYF